MPEENIPDINADRGAGPFVSKVEVAEYLAEILPELARIAKLAHLSELSDRLTQAAAMAVSSKDFLANQDR